MRNSWKVVVFGISAFSCFVKSSADEPVVKPTLVEFLKASAVPRSVIDGFLRGPGWAKFDPELGYVLANDIPTDGMDHSATLSTSRPDGARTSFMYTDRKCRINTYGDSFTQCHQVSDGETWQEYLASHLGEPIRNFGMGGYGVYQAYRRMIREEKTNHGAEYLILYIWGDDHIRSLLRCRYPLFALDWDNKEGRSFHGNPWSHLEMNLETGLMVEQESLLPTRDSLYQMTEPEWMVEHLKDDLALQLYAFKLGYIRDLDRVKVDKLAIHLGSAINWNEQKSLPDQVSSLLDRYSLRATKFILNKSREFADREGKKLMIVLFDPYRAMVSMSQNAGRYDQEIVDYLVREKFRFFDMNPVQLVDHARSNQTLQMYMSQYFIGHYNPRGNHFFAYSIKNRVVEWLDPKPITYRNPDPRSIDFQGYLQGRP